MPFPNESRRRRGLKTERESKKEKKRGEEFHGRLLDALPANSCRAGTVRGGGEQKAIMSKPEFVKTVIGELPNEGGFVCHVVAEGTGTHHARAADFCGRGVLDVASRPLHGPEKWQIHLYERF